MSTGTTSPAGRWQRWSERLLQEASYAAIAPARTQKILRWLLVFLVVGLGVAVAYQVGHSPRHCFEASISAYYYTPARAIFVASLVAIGVCLLAMKGKSAAEDAMLNFAGILAPIVAIVPTPPPKTMSCAIPTGQGGQRADDVANNMLALFVVGLLALGLALWLVYRPGQPRATDGERAAVLAAAVLWVVGVIAFFAARGAFLATAHYTAAIVMFAAVVVVVGINGLLARRDGRPILNRYTVIAGLMLLVSVVVGVAGWAGWDHWVIAIEVGLILLFAAFWCLQTTAADAQLTDLPAA